MDLEFRRSSGLEIWILESLPCKWHLSERVNEVTHREKVLELSLRATRVCSYVGSKEDAGKRAQKGILERQGRGEKQKPCKNGFMQGSVKCIKMFNLCWFKKATPHSVPLRLFLAIIVYRLPWTWKCSKLLMKSIHAGLHTIATILVIIALVSVFDFHNALNIPNMYSLHSWVGLTVVILYILQVSLLVCL